MFIRLASGLYINPTNRYLLRLLRIVRPKLPKVYVYDHCPFCVRVRLALGLKNVKHTLHFLANDDVDTPTALVGKKIAPIFVSYLLLRLIISACTLHFGLTNSFCCLLNLHYTTGDP